jgi:alpha-beta hydrolase superfamily lysophospholipase
MDGMERDILNLSVTQFGKDKAKLATFRFPAPDPSKRKAVCFYIHGFGTSIWFNRKVIRDIADQNYDVFAID